MVNKITTPPTTLELIGKVNELVDNKQDTLVSGTNIKTVNGNSLLGSGNIDIQGGGSSYTAGTGIDITNNVISVEGIKDQRNTSTAIKTWTGTRAQYDAIATKDSNTLYNITDDSDTTLTLLEALYPVGSVYITTASTCPLSTLISGSTWTLVSSGIVKAGDIPCKGNGKTVGWTDGTNNYGTVNGDGDSSYKGRLTISSERYDQSVTTSNPASRSIVNGIFGITTDSSKSGIIADTSSLTLAVNIFERTA